MTSGLRRNEFANHARHSFHRKRLDGKKTKAFDIFMNFLKRQTLGSWKISSIDRP